MFSIPEIQLWSQSVLALWAELSTSLVLQSTRGVHLKPTPSRLSTLPHQNWSKPDPPSKFWKPVVKSVSSVVPESVKPYLLWNLLTTLPKRMVVTLYSLVLENELERVTIFTTR